LQSPRERRARGLSLLEGSRLILDCLAHGAEILEVFLDERMEPETLDSIQAVAEASGVPTFRVARGLLRRLSAQEAAEGAAATVRIPAIRIEHVLGRSPLVVCHRTQNPGNLGAVVRSCAGLGAAALIGSGGADPYGPKALRGASGATYCLPVLRWSGGLCGLCDRLVEAGYEILLAEPRGGEPHTQIKSGAEPVALLLGAEAGGFAEAELRPDLPLRRVSIRLRGPVESLNVAVAAGILLDRLVRSG
jgi:TrmH family RNA methyltransferase